MGDSGPTSGCRNSSQYSVLTPANKRRPMDLTSLMVSRNQETNAGRQKGCVGEMQQVDRISFTTRIKFEEHGGFRN